MDFIVGKVGFKAPVLEVFPGLAVTDTSRNFVCLLSTILAGPSIESAGITPVRSYGVCNALGVQSML